MSTHYQGSKPWKSLPGNFSNQKPIFCHARSVYKLYVMSSLLLKNILLSLFLPIERVSFFHAFTCWRNHWIGLASTAFCCVVVPAAIDIWHILYVSPHIDTSSYVTHCYKMIAFMSFSSCQCLESYSLFEKELAHWNHLWHLIRRKHLHQ